MQGTLGGTERCICQELRRIRGSSARCALNEYVGKSNLQCPALALAPPVRAPPEEAGKDWKVKPLGGQL
jgi:hypothetical protein